MKQFLTALLILLGLLLAKPVQAQIIGGGVSWSGTTNAPANITNQVYLPIRTITGTFSPSSTNLTLAGNLYVRFTGNTNLFFLSGATNIWGANSTTNWTPSWLSTNYQTGIEFVFQGQWGTNIAGVHTPTNTASGTGYVP